MLFLGFRFESKKNDYRVCKVNTTKGNMVMSHHMVPLAGGPTFSGFSLVTDGWNSDSTVSETCTKGDDHFPCKFQIEKWWLLFSLQLPFVII
ncbi:hypothetical protein P8452_04225 [Trifolium repens]|nr:hypothetical protein P8452_04225 [Trifolium repens]